MIINYFCIILEAFDESSSRFFRVLFKLFELLGEQHYLPEIPMLKDREKLIEQDTIWKKICGELDWEFIATI